MAENAGFAKFGGKMKRKKNLTKGGANLDEKIQQLRLQTKSRKNARRRKKGKKKNDREKYRYSGNKDTITELLTSIKTRPKFTKMVEYSLDCLKNLAVDQVATEELIESGVIEELMRVMKLNPYNEKIQRAVNDCFSTFAKNESLAKMMMERMGTKGPQPFIRSLNKHVEPKTLEGTADVLVKLMVVPETVKQFVEMKGVKGAVHVLETQKTEAAVMAGAAHILQKVSAVEANQPMIVESGCIPHLVEAVKTFPEDAAVVEHSLGVIAQVAHLPGAQKILKEIGAVDVLVAALEYHPYNEQILQLGALCFAQLTDMNDLSNILSVQPGDSLACAIASNKFAAMALVEKNAVWFYDNHGVHWITECAKLTVDHATESALKVQQASLLGIARMCVDDHKVHALMTEMADAQAVKALRNHKEHAGVVGAAITALTEMCGHQNPAYALYMAQRSCANVAQTARLHTADSDIAHATIKYYKKIAAHSRAVGELMAQKVPSHIHAILQDNETHQGIVKDAIITFGRMSFNAPNMKAIIAIDEMKTINTVVDINIENPEIAALGLALLENVALLGEEGKKLLADCGAIDTINKAADIHSEDAHISALTARVLKLINSDEKMAEAHEMVGSIAQQMMSGDRKAQGQMVGSLQNAINSLSLMTVTGDNLATLIQQGAESGLLQSLSLLATMDKTDHVIESYNAASTAILRMAVASPNVMRAVIKGGHITSLLKQAILMKGNLEFAQNAMELCDLALAVDVDTLVAGGCIAKLIAILQDNPGERDLIIPAMSALARIAKHNPAYVAQIIAAGGGQLLVDGLLANIEDPALTAQTLSLFTAFAKTPEGLAVLQALGKKGVDSLIEAMKMHPNDATVLEAALNALSALLGDEEMALHIGKSGILPQMVNSIRTHYSNGNLIEADVVLLDSLCSVKPNQELILSKELKLNAPQLIQWVQTSFAAHPVTVAAANRLMAKLKKGKKKRSGPVGKSHGKEAEQKVKGILGGALKSTEELERLNRMMQDPGQAAFFASNGGMDLMSNNLMDPSMIDQSMFLESTDCFVNMLDSQFDESNLIPQTSMFIGALCGIASSPEIYGDGVDVNHLTYAVSAMADWKLTDDTIHAMLATNPEQLLQALFNAVTQSDDPDLLLHAAKLLANLSQNEAAYKWLSQVVNLRGLIEAMRRNIKLPSFLKYAVALLSKLALNKDLKGPIGQEGGPSVLCTMLDYYKDNEAQESLIANTLLCINRLTIKHDKNGSIVHAFHGIDLIVECLALYDTNLDILHNGINVLRSLASFSTTYTEAIMMNDGAAVISDVILQNFDEVDLLQICFKTLGSMANNAVNVNRILESGGVQGLVAGMTVHGDNYSLIKVAMKMLSIFGRYADKSGMDILADEGAVQAIVEACETYKDNLELAPGAFSCLLALARKDMPQNVSMMVKQNCTNTVLESLEDLGYDEKVVQTGTTLLSKLSTSKNDIDRMLKAPQIANKLHTCLSVCSENKKVRSNCLATVMRLANGERSAQFLAKQCPDLLRYVLSLFRDGVNDPQLVAQCFGVLSSLSRDPDSALMMAESALILMSNAFTQHSTLVRVIVPGLNFCRNLVICQEAGMMVTRANTVLSLLTVCQLHKEDPMVIRTACASLEAIASVNQAVRNHMKQSGVEEAMQAIKENFATNDDVVIQANNCLDAMNQLDKVQYIKPEKINISTEIMGKRRNKGPQKKAEVTLNPQIRNFLLAGDTLTKHSKTAQPRQRQVYFSTNLDFFIWKDPSDKKIKAENKMKVVRLVSVDKGKTTPQLQRKNYLGRPLVKDENCAFSVVGSDVNKKRRTVDLEAKSKAERDRWVKAISALIAYTKDKRARQAVFATSSGI